MYNFFIGLINSIISGLGSIMNGLMAVLPRSPFQTISNEPVQDILGYINWVIPINEMVNILQVWLVAVAMFYIYMVIMRWIKMI